MNDWTDAMRRLPILLLALSLGACSVAERRDDKPVAAVADTGAPDERGDPAARFTEALDLFKRNRLAEAEAAFLALEADFPGEHAGVPINLGLIYLRSGRQELAIGALSRAEAIAPNNPVVHNALGVAYQRSGQLERARQAYARAIELDPDYAAAHLNLGMLLETELGQAEQALIHYQRYLDLVDDEELRVQAWIAAIRARKAETLEPRS